MSIRARLSSRPRMTPHEGGGRASASWIHSPRIYVPHRPWRGSSERPSKQCDAYLKVLYKSIWTCPSVNANNYRSTQFNNISEGLTQSEIEQAIHIRFAINRSILNLLFDIGHAKTFYFRGSVSIRIHCFKHFVYIFQGFLLPPFGCGVWWS